MIRKKSFWTILIFVLVVAGAGAMLGGAQKNGQGDSLVIRELRSRPPVFLYALYGGDRGFVKEEVYTKEEASLAFKDPLAVTVTPEQRVFVADTGHGLIQAFDAEGRWVASYGQGRMAWPSGITSSEHKLYIADSNLKKIFVYGEDGKEYPLLLDRKELPLTGGRQGDIIRPSNIQVGPDRLFYITDIANQCIVVMDEQGSIVRSFGTTGKADGQFQYPNAVCVGKNGKVYVTDSNNGRIQIFNKEGKFLTKITGSNGKLGSLALPRGLAVTSEGAIFVVDVFTHKVRVLDEAGIELWSFGEMGTRNGQFNFPNGLCIDSKGRIYVTDRENNRIQVFGYK